MRPIFQFVFGVLMLIGAVVFNHEHGEHIQPLELTLGG